MIIETGKFKKQWWRGKLSRKLKKQIRKELGFVPWIPSEDYLKSLAYSGLVTSRRVAKSARSIEKAFSRLGESAETAAKAFDALASAKTGLEVSE